ncbi:MAG TPA: ABC transporter substrate-binding protein, partial [Actinomycetota bacterium]|nr:ABC transporter substrate-binding protein [Actinomycetota bacterium]
MAETNQPDGSRRDRAHHDVQIRTFLIADVRGWTLFTQERGDEAAAKLAAKFADVVREVVDARGGDLLELRGDEAMCVFSSAREAIRSAVDLQVRFVEETLDQPELPLTVGIGLDAGEAVAVQGGYRGGALNLAARLCGQARAGEVLASREVTHLARRLDGIRYEDRGALTFKNIPDPVEVVRVAPEELDTVERLRPFTPTPPLPPKRSRRWIVAVAVAAVLALVAIAIPLLGSDAPGPITLGSNAVTRLDAADGSVESTTSLRQRPGATVTGFGSVWVAYPDGRAVERLDAGDGTRTDTIEVGSSPSGIAIGHGSVWVTNAGDGTVSRIDPETGIVTEEFRAGASPSGIAVGDGALWVADGVGASLLRIDPASGRSDVVELDGQPTSVAFTEDGVWVAVAPDEVVLVDPDDLSITLTQPTGARPTAIVRAFDSIWVANDLDGTITRLDPSTGNEQATIAVGDGPASIVGAGERLWIAIEHDDAVVAIDPGTNDVERQLPVGATAASVASTGESLWLAVGASAGEHRGGTLAISSSGTLFDAPSLDPAIAYDPETWRVLTATNDGLVAYERVGGPAGASLVPDLASALPDVSADGLTYRFPLREGIRYSTGDPVRPEDFRRAIERAVLLHPAGLYLYSAIEGTSACTAEPPTCDLSDGIEVDARS